MVNVDTVYQRVLTLANKEQRGYITPQEFNLLANQAQMDIFEQYFYDLNQFRRLPGNDTLYADMVGILEEKIETFHKETTIGPGSNPFDLPSDYYRLAQVRYNNTTLGYGVEIEKLPHKKLLNAGNSPLTAPTLSRPVYYIKDTKITVNPNSINMIDVSYIRKPINVNWTYIVVGEKALYNNDATDAQNFELHPSEETKLVIKILGLAGITLKDPGLYQIAGAEDNNNIQQEKQ